MTAAEAVEASVSVTDSVSQDYTNLYDLPSPACTDPLGSKPFTIELLNFMIKKSWLYINNFFNDSVTTKRNSYKSIIGEQRHKHEQQQIIIMA